MIWYHLIFSDNRKAVGYAWNLMGFVAKLSQGVSHSQDSRRDLCLIIESSAAWSPCVSSVFFISHTWGFTDELRSRDISIQGHS